jgi:replication initiator protein RepSA
LAQLIAVTEGELRRLVRISCAKVAEYQKRGAVHFHAIIRLDAATDCACPACVTPPPPGFTAELLEAAIRQTAATVGVPCPAVDEDQAVTLIARWGEQLDVRHIGADHGEELSEEQVAGYIAKYTTKCPEALGVTLDHYVGEVELEGLEVPAHVAELVRVFWELGARPSLARLRLRKWAHMLGYELHRLRLSDDRGGVAGRLRRRVGAGSTADRQGGATNHTKGGMTKNCKEWHKPDGEVVDRC